MTTHAKLAKAYLDQLCDRLDRGERVTRPRKWWKLAVPAAVGAGLGLAACGGNDTGSDTQAMEEGYDCQYLPGEPEPQELNCHNQIDDDGDGLTDCDDADCLLACSMVSLYAAPMPFPEVCDNQLDDDNDGQVDCADADCVNDINCSATALYAAPAPDLDPQEICDNCLDDDGDGSFDCADADCIGHPGCPPLPELNCSNEVDDDGDGVTDCDDEDCALDVNCSATALYAAPAPEPEPEPDQAEN